MRLSVGPGDTLLLPSAWPHAVSTPEAALAVGGCAAVLAVGAAPLRCGVLRWRWQCVWRVCRVGGMGGRSSHSRPQPCCPNAAGGNFLHALDFGALAGCYRRERRLGVTPKFQVPMRATLRCRPLSTPHCTPDLI